MGIRDLPNGLRLLLALAWRMGSALHKSWLARRQGIVQGQGHLPLVVVGNCRIGGGGKTPLCAEVARYLAARGLRVTVLAPPLFGRAHGQIPPEGTAEDWGDEPIELARELNPIPVWAWRDRVRVWESLERTGLWDVVLCDDGLEDPRLRSGFCIRLDTGETARGLGQLWPAGDLRSLPTDHPDARVWSWASAWETRAVASDWVSVLLPPRNAQGMLLGSTPWLICGVGNPHRLLQDLRCAGVNLAGSTLLADHSRGIAHAVRAVWQREPDRAVLVTPKDAVKLPAEWTDDPRLYLVKRRWQPRSGIWNDLDAHLGLGAVAG